jgi:hypothetical protein
MRKHVLVALAAIFAASACIGGNGPNANAGGKGACAQLKECQCAPDRTSDVEACETQYGALESPDGGQDLCAALLRSLNACGDTVEVDPSRVGL